MSLITNNLDAIITIIICLAYALGLYELFTEALDFIKYVIWLFFEADDDE
jgi:hypothetical protein